MIRRRRISSENVNRPGAPSVRAVLLSLFGGLAVLWAVAACAPMGVSSTAAGPSAPAYPPIEDSGMTNPRSLEAAGLIRAAVDSLSAGAFEVALQLAQGVIRDFPGAPGSSEALEISARALGATGRPGQASAQAMRLMEILDQGHPARPGVSMLAAETFRDSGDPDAAVFALEALPGQAPAHIVDSARTLLREIVPGLPSPSLRSAAERYPASNPLRGLLAAEWASALYFMGDDAEAIRWAELALSGPLDMLETDIANGVLEGRLESVLGRPLILGAILPRSEAPPGLLQYGEWVLEGIQVALDEFADRLPRPVQLEVIDDQGTPAGGRLAVETLESAGALGALGLLTQDLLQEAAASRLGDLALLSPFSYIPPEDAAAVYSLSGPDPGGARLVARMAWELGLQSVAVVRPATLEARVNTLAFQEEYEALGGIVPRDIVFDSGGTFFQAQLQQVETILPDGLFLPLAPRDIQLLAPQVTFYGLDTLGIQLLGTSGWTDEAVVQEVDSRHTDGVVAATVRLTQDESEAFLRFRDGYEAFYQKTLRSQVPAFGYDAASLLLRALEAGPRTSRELIAAMEEIRDLQGATGNLSVDRGWVTREPLLVRIQDHELIYISRRPNQGNAPGR